MSKVYSLVLSEEVINEVDREAYKEGLSRSAMIERILAEYLSYETPKMWIDSIFEELERAVGRHRNMRLLARPSAQTVCVGSALNYRYNPSVRYTVELTGGGEKRGKLSVSLRTQNAALIEAVTQFFRLFASLERRYVSAENGWSEGGFVRRFDLEKSAEPLGEKITEYIRAFDSLLNLYFGGAEGREGIIEKKFRDNIDAFNI